MEIPPPSPARERGGAGQPDLRLDGKFKQPALLPASYDEERVSRGAVLHRREDRGDDALLHRGQHGNLCEDGSGRWRALLADPPT